MFILPPSQSYLSPSSWSWHHFFWVMVWLLVLFRKRGCNSGYHNPKCFRVLHVFVIQEYVSTSFSAKKFLLWCKVINQWSISDHCKSISFGKIGFFGKTFHWSGRWADEYPWISFFLDIHAVSTDGTGRHKSSHVHLLLWKHFLTDTPCKTF